MVALSVTAAVVATGKVICNFLWQLSVDQIARNQTDSSQPFDDCASMKTSPPFISTVGMNVVSSEVQSLDTTILPSKSEGSLSTRWIVTGAFDLMFNGESSATDLSCRM